MTSLVPKPPFPIPDTVLYHIISYLEYSDLKQFCTTTKSAYTLQERGARIIFSAIKIFDRAHWKEYYNAEITSEYDPNNIDLSRLKRFLGLYYGKNPIGPGRVCDHCLMPTVVPSRIMRPRYKYNFYEPYTLFVLGELAQSPVKGAPAKFESQSDALKQCGNKSAGPSRLVIQLKGVYERTLNKTWSQKSLHPSEWGQVQILHDLFLNTGWGVRPDAISQNTILFAHHVFTRQRSLGNTTGLEGRVTYGRTADLVRYGQNQYPMVSGNFKKIGPVLAQLNIADYDFKQENCGVVVMIKI